MFLAAWLDCYCHQFGTKVTFRTQRVLATSQAISFTVLAGVDPCRLASPLRKPDYCAKTDRRRDRIRHASLQGYVCGALWARNRAVRKPACNYCRKSTRRDGGLLLYSVAKLLLLQQQKHQNINPLKNSRNYSYWLLQAPLMSGVCKQDFCKKALSDLNEYLGVMRCCALLTFPHYYYHYCQYYFYALGCGQPRAKTRNKIS